MALFPFLKRRDAAGAASTPAEEVQRARTRARQRLIGAVVLLGVGIIGFPLLFETQPRPIPVDVTIEIPRKDAVPPLQPPGSGPRASGEVTVAPAAPPPPSTAAVETPAPIEPPPTTAAAPTAAPASAMAAAAPTAAPAAPAAPVAAPPAPHPAPPVAAAPAKVPSPPPAATEGGGRFVVQVGAFADRGAAQRTRERVERLGLKTYTQVITTAEGERTRVRVGPFASRDEADKAAARLQSAGLSPAVLSL
jgi:DedD protein